MPGLLLEPPGPHVPGDATGAPALGPLRLTAAVAATACIVVGHGPGIVPAVLLAVAVAAPAGVVAVALAAWAVALRWGSTWLVAIGGGQAVLGVGFTVGPGRAAAATVLAAAALVLVTPPVSWVGAMATGTAAAFVVAGPAGGSGAGVRVLATATCIGAALGVGVQPWRRAAMVAGVVAGAAALALVA